VEDVSPVVCVNRDLKPQDELVSLESAVQIIPDLWPAFADSAYMTLQDIEEDPDLVAIVHPLDRERVPTTEDAE
jgi:hypothetical protein